MSLEAEVVALDPAYGLATLKVAGGSFLAPSREATPGERRRLKIHATDVSLAVALPPRTSIANVLPARVLGVERRSGYVLAVALGLGADGEGARILAQVSKYSWDALALSVGAEVYAQVKAVALEPRNGAGA